MKPNEITSINLRYIRGTRSKRILFDNSWELLEDIPVHLSNGEAITIPKGFRTDFSSVPEFMWGVLKPFGDFILAPIVHDWLYVTKYKADELGLKEARKFADREMFYISQETNSQTWWRRLDNRVRYWGVRLFGAHTFKKDTRKGKY